MEPASGAPVTPVLVGEAFAKQYYNVLELHPQHVHRFYMDSSRLTRAEFGSQGPSTIMASTQAEIHKVIVSLANSNFRIEIKTLDAQDSFGGSVFVLVTGIMYRDNSIQNFVQSFFLAPQERGYYVLNDIFRFLDADPQSVPSEHNAGNGVHSMLEGLHISQDADNEALSHGATIHDEAVVSDYMHGYSDHDIYSDLKEAAIDDRGLHQQEETFAPERLAPREQVFTSEDLQVGSLEDASAEKRSYASILRSAKESNMRSSQVPASNPVHQQVEQQVLSYQLSNYSAQVSGRSSEEPVLADNEGEIKSVYIRNLPTSITESELEDELRKFGSIRSNGIILRAHKEGGSYAFVEFENADSALSAIKVSPIFIGGQSARVEPKKSTFGGGRGRGRGQGSRGNIQNLGSRSRGFNATGSTGRGDLASRARGSRPSRGGNAGANTRS